MNSGYCSRKKKSQKKRGSCFQISGFDVSLRNVSLRKLSKRFQIKLADREERISEYLKNIWTVQKFFIDNFGVDPPIINGDQMPLHRNESASQITLNFSGLDTYVKENYSLARERVTVYTQVANDASIYYLNLYSREKEYVLR